MNATLSSGVMPVSLNSDSAQPGVNRGLFSDWFGANKIAAEDWIRAEQSADFAFQRDLQRFDAESKFNAQEAQKQRNFEERMASTAYQRTINDLKAAGYNPVLAFQQGPVSSGSGSSASASIGSSSGSSSNASRGSQANTSQFIGSLVSLVAWYSASCAATRL